MEEIINNIIQAEWEQFQRTQNVGGRASCQNNYPQFYGMRYGQFAAWSVAVRLSYLNDLSRAREQGRNLVSEKYLRMMEFTFTDEYEGQKDNIPQLTHEHKFLADEICDQMICQTIALQDTFPMLLRAGRPLRSSEDGYGTTSIQTYLRGELYTYSIETLQALKEHLLNLQAEGRSLSGEILKHTVAYYGYKSLAAAEAALRQQSECNGGQ